MLCWEYFRKVHKRFQKKCSFSKVSVIKFSYISTRMGCINTTHKPLHYQNPVGTGHVHPGEVRLTNAVAQLKLNSDVTNLCLEYVNVEEERWTGLADVEIQHMSGSIIEEFLKRFLAVEDFEREFFSGSSIVRRIFHWHRQVVEKVFLQRSLFWVVQSALADMDGYMYDG